MPSTVTLNMPIGSAPPITLTQTIPNGNYNASGSIPLPNGTSLTAAFSWNPNNNSMVVSLGGRANLTSFLTLGLREQITVTSGGITTACSTVAAFGGGAVTTSQSCADTINQVLSAAGAGSNYVFTPTNIQNSESTNNLPEDAPSSIITPFNNMVQSTATASPSAPDPPTI
jgi:hypothetical protein